MLIQRVGQRIISIGGPRYTMPRSAAALGWWVVPGKTCVAAYQPKGAASLAASYSNLQSPGTYDAAPVVAPGWAAGTGWAFNGTAYLTTGIIAAAGWSMMIRYASTVGTGVMAGARSTAASTDRFYLGASNGSNQVRYGYGVLLSVTPQLLTGTLAVAGAQGYRDGASDGAAIGGSPAGLSVDIWIGGYNQANSIQLPYVGNVLAMAVYSATLSAAEVATLYAAMAAL